MMMRVGKPVTWCDTDVGSDPRCNRECLCCRKTPEIFRKISDGISKIRMFATEAIGYMFSNE